MNEVYLIDGYNIIGAMGDEGMFSLAHARDRLMDMVSDFAGYTQKECVLVFDGHKVQRGRGAQYTQAGPLTVVFTKEDETADQYIERETMLRVRRGQTVRVCTND
ncbi:MAG: NYN domain-containing protein, partial [Clostridia bacterium]|nr:NYN domain-containing protein [Clostridia bacterium]